MTDQADAPLSGVYPVLPTIFDDDGAIDRDGFDAVIDYVLGAGADGVVFPGLASEASDLTREERVELVTRVGERVAGRAQFIVGASAEAAEDSILYAQTGAQVGARAAMVITPKATGGDVGRLTQFYTDVAQSAGLPVMLQNAPAPMGLGLSVGDIASIAKAVGGIHYIKEETMPCGQRITAMHGALSDSVRGILGGAGGRYILDELNRGALGTLPACEITEIHVAMVAAYHTGRTDEAYALFERSLPLLVMQAIFRWRLTKELLKRRGLISSSYTRATGPEMDAQDLIELTTLYERLNFEPSRFPVHDEPA